MPIPIYVDSMASQQTRLAVEQSYGELPASPTWLRTSDMRLIPKPQLDTEVVIGAGDELPSGVIINDDFSNVDVSGRAGYTSLMYPVASLFGFPTDALVTGSTYDHTWTWDGRTPIIPASYGLHYGLPGRADEILGYVFNGLGMTVARGGYDFSTSGFGKAITTGVAMGGVTNEVQTATITGTPTGGSFTLTFKGRTTATILWNSTAATVQAALEALSSIGIGNVLVTGGPGPGTPYVITFIGKLGAQDVPLMTAAHTFTGGTTPNIAVAATTPGADTAVTLSNVPIAPLHFDIYAGDSWAEMQAESTKFLAVYSAEMGWGERWARSMPVNSTKSSDSIYTVEDQEHTLALRMGADATSRGMYATARAGSKKYIRLHAIGPATGDAANKYEFVIDLAMILTGTDGYDSENGIHVLSWNGQLARDEVGNNAVVIRIRNKRAAL